MTYPSTRRIFACLFLNHSNDKRDYSFQKLTKIGVGVSKEKYESHTSSDTSKNATSASAYLKNYFGSDSKQRHTTPTSDSDFTTLA